MPRAANAPRRRNWFNRNRLLLFLLATVGMIFASVVVIAQKPTVLGLDLQGGVEVILQGKATRDAEVTTESINRSVEIIRGRVDAFGVSEPEIQTQGEDQIVVSLPGVASPDRAVQDLIKPAQLIFTDYQANLVTQDKSLWKLINTAQTTTPTPPVDGQASYYLFKRDKAHTLVAGPEYDRQSLLAPYSGKLPGSMQIRTVKKGLVIYEQVQQLDPTKPTSPSRTVYVLMQDHPALTGIDVTSAAQAFDTGTGTNEPIVTMQFSDRGAERFQEVTRQIAQRGLLKRTLESFAIILDGEIISTPTIDGQEYPGGISGNTGAQISGNFDQTSARTLADQLNSGAIPIRLEVISQRQVSATLGEESLRQALWAGLAGLVLVLLFLIVYYRFLGVIAAGAIVVYGIFYWAVAELIPITLTLPGIAGAILTIGVAADANVIIFERVREEMRAGRTPRDAIRIGYNKGLPAILDANAVTFLTAAVLFIFGTAGPKGFALVLMVGVILSLLTAVVMTRAIVTVFGNTRLFQNARIMGLNQREPRWKFDVVGKWKMWLAITFTPMLIGFGFLAVNGLNLGLDFTSGTRVNVAFVEKQPSEGTLREVVARAGYPEARIQTTTDDKGRPGFQIQTEDLNPKELAALRADLAKDVGQINVERYTVETVGPSFGRQVIINALWAVALSFALILAYLWIRFEWRLALPALLSVVHDLGLSIAVYAIFGFEFSSATVAALLTILGYSLYDVVVVFDRVRENIPLMKRARYRDVVNRSVHEMFTRSIITATTTTVPVAVLWIFGGEALRNFSFALFVGLLAGGVSSIVIAAPIAALLKERQARREGDKRAYANVYGDRGIGEEYTGERGYVAPEVEAPGVTARPRRVPRPRNEAARKRRRKHGR